MPAYGTGVVAVDGLGERGDVADVVEDVVAEDPVGAAERVLPARREGEAGEGRGGRGMERRVDGVEEVGVEDKGGIARRR